MFQIGIDGFVLSQSAELIRPVDENVTRSCAFSSIRSLEDLAFALVYGEKILKYGDLRPPSDPRQYSVPELINHVDQEDGTIWGEFRVDQDIHGDRLLQRPSDRGKIISDLGLLEEYVRSSPHPALFMEWIARESTYYFGKDESVFVTQSDPAGYRYGTRVPYHMDREIQRSIAPDVVEILLRAVRPGPKGTHDYYSEDARREFITRNMLTLVTINLAYELSAERTPEVWRVPHATRVDILLWCQVERQVELRRLAARYPLYKALMDTPPHWRELVIKNLCDQRKQEIPTTIREMLGELDLLSLTADITKEGAARRLVDEINNMARPLGENEEPVTFKRRAALRQLGSVTWPHYLDALYYVFPELRTDYDIAHTFKPPWEGDLDSLVRVKREEEIALARAVEGLADELARLEALKPQARGYAFERFLQSLFEAYHLAPRTDIKLVGEQIDLSFQSQGATYLVEATWRGAKTKPEELMSFNEKIGGKAKWTRGLLLSYAGFTKEGCKALARGRPTSIVCMDGDDLHDMLQRGLDFRLVLESKARRAAETNEAFVSVRDLFP